MRLLLSLLLCVAVSAQAGEVFQQSLTGNQTPPAGTRYVDSSITAPGVTALTAAASGITVDLSTVTAGNFGALLNTTTSSGPVLGVTLFGVRGSTIVTGNADGVEINAPGADFEQGLVLGNFVTVNGNPAPSAGFGIGVADARNVSVVGNAIDQQTPREIIHVEGSQRRVSVVGNVGRGKGDGIRLFEAAAQDGMPVAVVGNSVENTGSVPTGYGVYDFWSNHGSLPGSPVIGNVAINYAECFHVGGVQAGEPNTALIVAGNAGVNCPYTITAWGSANFGTVRQIGTNLAEGPVTALFMTHKAGAHFGKVISLKRPGQIIANLYTGGYAGTIPSTAEGFEIPGMGFTASATGARVALYTMQGAAFGRVAFDLKSNSGTDWLQYSATILYQPGQLLVVKDELPTFGGNVAGVALSVVNGQLCATVTTKAGTTASFIAGWDSFDGEWRDK